MIRKMIISRNIIFDELETLRLNIKDVRWNDNDNHEVVTLHKNYIDDENDEITLLLINEEYFSHDFDDCS